MDDNDEDELYADDGFDTLSQNELLRLEQNAVRAAMRRGDITEHSGHPEIPPRPLSRYPTAFQKPIFKRNPAITRTAPPQEASSDYGDFDPNEIDIAWLDNRDEPMPVEEKEVAAPLRPPGEVPQGEQWRQHRHAGANNYPQNEMGSRAEDYVVQNRDGNSGYDEYGDEIQMQDSTMENEALMQPIPEQQNNNEAALLRAQIQELLRERDALRYDLSAANSNALAKAGEIAVVRANQSKTVKNYDRQIAALQRSMAEETAKFRLKLEIALTESKKARTENQFLKQDLSEEAEKVKNLQRNLKGKERADKANPTVTPKKSISLPLRDGFNDDEIAMISPSRSARRSKKATPSAGEKRKRRVTQDSPIPALELSQSRHGSFEELPLVITDAADIEEPPSKARPDKENFIFMQRMLYHRTHPGHQPILEVFMNYKFPSEPAKSLSSLLFERTSVLGPDNYPAEFTKVIISLWKRCLDEKYHEPVCLLMDLVSFILALDAPGIAPHIIHCLIPVAQDTGRINGIPRFKNSSCSHLTFGRFKLTPQRQLDPLVDATKCLNLLYSAGTGCLHEERHFRLFWELMQFDFILMNLNSSQPIADITINLNLLATSIFPTTFGPIFTAAQNQRDNERYLIERITCLLMETPVADEGEPPPTMMEICELRIEALSLLSQLALSSPHPHLRTDPSGELHHGSLLLARHPTCLARLIRSMYDELDMLYTDSPTAPLHCILINNATRLVYRIFKLHPTEIDMKPKWTAVPGGMQKQLIVLSRLAFSEGLWLERGIEDETAEMAHELLEEFVNLEEAAMVLQAFPHMSSGGASGREAQDIDEDEEMALADSLN